jgi:hypothetical protein
MPVEFTALINRCVSIPGWLALVLFGCLAGLDLAKAQVTADTMTLRHLGLSRERAANQPRREDDQAIVNGWPMYRTERGQTAFNTAMATLAATDVEAPAAATFKGCDGLLCQLALPAIDTDGWMAPGRLWTSPSSYVLVVRSPRQRDFRRRSVMNMRYFVMHEFHNSSRNTDVFDTVSSHSGSVFVPLYLSKTQQDARGRSFVMLVQVAPIDVVSVHASNMGSEGPGVEIALNSGDTLEPLQGLGAMLAAKMAKAFQPRLSVVNHRGEEGRSALRTYEAHARAATSAGARFAVPFSPAAAQKIATVTGRFETLVARRGGSVPIAVAKRSFVPRQELADPAIEIPSLAMAAVAPRATFLGRNTEPDVAAEATKPKLLAPPQLAQRPNRAWSWSWPWSKPASELTPQPVGR